MKRGAVAGERAELLGIGYRQAKRAWFALSGAGDAGLVHPSRAGFE